MSSIPTKRVLVYIAVGLVVLIVGAAGLLAARGDGGDGTDPVVIGSADQAEGGASGWTDALDVAGTTTSSTAPPLIFVQVAGAVRRPGVYQLPEGARAFEAVREAGGLTDEADEEAVPLAARVTDGCRLYVPRVGEVAATPALTGDQQAGSGSSRGPVSLNSATLEELDSLPGIGPSLAQQILAYREAQGPFTSVDQLNEVPGIGPSKLEQLRPLVGL